MTIRPGETDLWLPTLFPWQQRFLDSPARFKVLRKGRRGGGSQVALDGGIDGHGPAHHRVGMVDGGLIIWVGPDYKQTEAIWREQIVPRFEPVSNATINQNDYRVELAGGGALEVISAKNAAAMRGRGPHGLILDEAAHYDLQDIWTNICRPALATRKGWAMFVSTTNKDQDGNSAHRAPSYFNILASVLTDTPLPEGITAPKLGKDWAEFHVRTRDNPKIDAAEMQSLYDDLGGADSIAAQQELDALLLVGGTGSAFPRFSRDIHVVPDREPPRSWLWYGGLDWGYRQGSYHLYAVSSEGDVEAVWEFYDQFRELHAREAAAKIFEASQYFPVPDIVYYDDQMEQDTGIKGGMTLIEEWYAGLAEHFGGLDRAPIMEPAAKGPGSRNFKFNMTQRFLAYDDTARHPGTGALQPWGRPKLRIQQKCRALIGQLATLPVDPRDPEDVDTVRPDHAYDDLGNLLLSRMRMPEKPQAPWSEDQHPGLDRGGLRKRRVLTMQEEAQEMFAEAPTLGYRAPRWGSRYQSLDDEEGLEDD